MTNKILKIAHGNTEYDLGSSQDDNFQVLKINEREDDNIIEATVYLQKINNNWASIHARVIEADILYGQYVFKIKGVLQPFVPKKSASLIAIAEEESVRFSVGTDGTLSIYCTNSKIPYKPSRPISSDFYALN